MKGNAVGAIALATALLLAALSRAWAVVPEPRTAPMTMEELVVRGLRERPGTLFFPVSPPIRYPAPARYDLLREDLLRALPLPDPSEESDQGGGAVERTDPSER